jgi:hypothetical protein
MNGLRVVYDEELSALQVFAAHIYYRALVAIPTLIRQWWLDCKDRQFSSAVNSFTISTFSPVIVHEQLAHLKDPAARAELQDESLTIKVALNVNEVTATYLVDEQQLEIGVRLPVNFPLQGVEVRDLKRVGVAESKWRGWLFNVQQGCQVCICAVRILCNKGNGLTLSLYAERAHSRRAIDFQEKHRAPFRRHGGVCDLLLVRPDRH